MEIGFDNDPFNVMTSNMLQVYDTLDSYVTVESEHFKVNLSEKDGQVLWPYLEPLLEESWDTLTAKYGFEPEGPILIQVDAHLLNANIGLSKSLIFGFSWSYCASSAIC